MELPSSDLSFRPAAAAPEAAPPLAAPSPSRDQFGRLLLLSTDALPTDQADQRPGGGRELPVPEPRASLRSAGRAAARLREDSGAIGPWGPYDSRETRRTDESRPQRNEKSQPPEREKASERSRASERREADPPSPNEQSTNQAESDSADKTADDSKETRPADSQDDAAADTNEEAVSQPETAAQAQTAQGNAKGAAVESVAVAEAAGRLATEEIPGDAAAGGDHGGGQESTAEEGTLRQGTPADAAAADASTAKEQAGLAEATGQATGNSGGAAALTPTAHVGRDSDATQHERAATSETSDTTNQENVQNERASSAESQTQATGQERGNSQRLATAQAAASITTSVQAAADAADGEDIQNDRPAEAATRSNDSAGLLSRMQQRAAGRAAGPNNTASTNGPQIDPARFVNRVVQAFRVAQERGGVLHLRLSPPELGSLRLELSLQNGTVSASVEAETAHARNALLDNLPVLRERLAQLDIRVERFDVDLLREGRQEQPGQQPFDRDGQSPSQEDGSPPRATHTEAEEVNAAATPVGELSQAGINYII